MALLNLQAYATASIHHAQALLIQARTAGLTDIDTLLGALARHLQSEAMADRKAISTQQRRTGRAAERAAKAKRSGASNCPSCGDGVLGLCQETSAAVGAPVLVCSRHCGYSEVANG